MADQNLNTPEEIWKPIPGFEGYYDISNQGRVRSYWQRVKRGNGNGRGAESILSCQPQRILRPKVEKNGYISVALSKGGQGHTIKVHRLVLLTFIGPCPPRMECCHADGSRSNNYLENLRWDIDKSNCKDRDRHGTTVKGEKQWKSKLTEGQIKQIREMASQGHSYSELGKLFSVTYGLIGHIVRRKVWAHIP